MDNSTLNENLIFRTKNSLDKLNHYLKKLDYIRMELENLLHEYTKYPSPQIDTEIRLRAMNSLFESYYLRQITGIERFEREPIKIHSEQVLHFYLSGKWLSHEMGQALYAINNIFQVFAVPEIAIDRVRMGYREAVRITDDVYRNAKLFYFLYPDEQLQLHKIVFSSPGELELLSQIIALTPVLAKTASIIFLAKIASSFIRDLPKIYESWIKTSHNIKDMNRKDVRAKILHILFTEKLQTEIDKRYTDSRNHTIKKAIEEINSANEKMIEANIADPINLGWREIRSLITIEKLLSGKKIDFDYSPEEDKTEIML